MWFGPVSGQTPKQWLQHSLLASIIIVGLAVATAFQATEQSLTKSLRIIVIGAGICGLSAAIWLRRAGHEVTLIDREGPGAGASFGNAGLLAGWAVVPVNTPGLLARAFKYLRDPQAPLFLQWGQLPRLAPWLRQLVANSGEQPARRTVDALIPLLTDCVVQHHALTRGTKAAEWVKESDFNYAYESRAAYESDSFDWAMRRQAGLVPEVIEGPVVQEIEPMLGDNIRCLVRLRGHGHIHDTASYMAALAEVLRDEGGTFRQAEAHDITLSDGRVTSVETDQGRLPCDHAVLAAGIWSKTLMRKLGVPVLLEAERGHHLHLRNPSQLPNSPMILGKGKFGVTPMATGLRCAGTVELGSVDAGPSRAPLELIRTQVSKYFPRLEYDTADEWVGFRPSTPDCLPLVGEIGQTGVHAAFGHQHIGLTAGPKTGRIIADLISGRTPNLDLAPYSATRFTRA